MKKMMILMMLTALMTVTTACSSDDPFESNNNYTFPEDNTGENTGGNTGAGGSSSVASGDLTTFTVAIDLATAEPTSDLGTVYYPDEEDNLSNTSANSFNEQEPTITIDLSNPTAKTENGVTVTVNGGHVTADHASEKNVCYKVTGSTSNGSLTILGDKKYEVILDGVDITNPDSAALNLLSKKRAFIMLADGSTNKLTDGTTSKNDHKGALYCKGKLMFNGNGKLEVYGNYNNAIHSADYIIFNTGNNIYAKSTANHGIKANDGIFINGGILNVEVSAAAAKGINCESNIMVNGGRTTVVTTGKGVYDTEDKETKSASCIKADSVFTMNGGELWLKSTGSGGKGINVDEQAYFNGGSTYVITEGGLYYNNGSQENTNYTGNTDNVSSDYYSSPKGIKAEGDLLIKGGRVWVRTSGYNGEGIETKSALTISGGEVASYAYDDAINSKGDMNISGGYVYAQGQHNDGLDANGDCRISGGVVYAICSGSPEVAIDANTEGGKKLYVTGGVIVAVGGLENGSSLSQACYQSSWSSNTWYALTYNGSTFAFKTPSSGGSGLVVSTPQTPTLLSGVTVSGGTSYFGGLGIASATVSGGTTVSLSSYTGGMGGGPGGGRW